MTDRVVVETDAGIAHVILNRPDKYNALDLPMFHALDETAAALAGDDALRAVILRGRGPAFCAGLDVQSLMQDLSKAGQLLERTAGEHMNLAQRVSLAWQALPVPVIAALHGKVFGGGLQIALGADLRYVAADTELSVMEIKWGLVPDMGGTQTLKNLVPLDVAKELTLTGRIVSGEEAVALGLATRLAPDPVEAATETARIIAGKSPDAVRAGKHLLNRAWQADEVVGLALETRLQVALIGRANQMEAVRANIEKRPPEFRDPAPLPED